MREFNVCVSNYSEYLRSGVNQSIFIKLPCDNIKGEIAKIGVYLEDVVPDAVEVDTVAYACDLNLFKEYIIDATVRGKADIFEINSIARKLAVLSDEDVDKLELFMSANTILIADLDLALNDFRNAQYYEALGYQSLAEILLEEGYFDDIFGIKYSELPEKLAQYIDLDSLADDFLWDDFQKSPSGELFLKRGEK
jgi:hypothetical protein